MSMNVIVSEYSKPFFCYCIGIFTNQANVILYASCILFFSLVYGVGKTRGKRNYMEDVDFALEAVRVKDKAIAAAYGSIIYSVPCRCM